MRLKLAILASGSGSNAQAIIEACQANSLNAEVALVFTNNPNAKVIERAKNLGVKCVSLSHKDFISREEFDKEMVRVLKEHNVDTIAMAGYMRLVTPYFIESFRNRIINVHPAILPAFIGAHAIEDAKNWNVKIFGLTVHFVDEIMDNGAIIIQAALPANFSTAKEEEESIELLHKFEHLCFVQALKWFADDRLTIEGRKVILTPADYLNYKNFENVLIYPPLELSEKISSEEMLDNALEKTVDIPNS